VYKYNFEGSKTIEQSPKIYNSLISFLRSLFPKLQLQCSYNLYPILVVIVLKLVKYLPLGALLQGRNDNSYQPTKMFNPRG
jgi:hypothetical protein